MGETVTEPLFVFDPSSLVNIEVRKEGAALRNWLVVYVIVRRFRVYTMFSFSEEFVCDFYIRVSEYQFYVNLRREASMF